MPSALNLPTSAACRKRVAMRGITPQRPSATRAESASSTATEPMLDERAKTLLKALVERYIADGQPVGSRTLSRATRPRPVAGDDPQRDGRSRGARLDRQPAHQRRPRPDARAATASSSTRMLTAQPSCRVGRPAAPIEAQLHADQPAARDRQRGAAAVEPVELRRRDHRAAASRACSTTSSSCACRSGASCVIVVAPDGDVQNRVIFTAQRLHPRRS